jgi:hypothetical protein
VTVLATVTDPNGVPVDLTDTQWKHVCEQRPLLAERRAEILRAVATPDATEPGKKLNEAWSSSGASDLVDGCVSS